MLDQPQQSDQQQSLSHTRTRSAPGRRRLFPWIGAGIVLVILLLVLGVIERSNLFGDGLPPDQVVQNYCQALTQHDYNRAVGYLAMSSLDMPDPSQPNGLRNVALSASSLQELEQKLGLGDVKGCSDTKIFASTSEDAIVNTTATLNSPASGDGPFNAMIHLVKVGKNWRISDAGDLY